jgi:hypothetical protein
MTLLVQILGGLFGLFVAWLIHVGFTSYHNRSLDKLKIQHQIELEEYKKSLLKSVK